MKFKLYNSMKTMICFSFVVFLLGFGYQAQGQCDISGGVLLDDGTIPGEVDGMDHLQHQVRVNLFRDLDCNGMVGTNDLLIDQVSTGSTGSFLFKDLYQGIGNETIIDTLVIVNEDDAEEILVNGTVDKLSSNLDFGENLDGNDQIVALRFPNVGVPFGATINYAYIRLNASADGVGSTNLTIAGEATASSPAITGGTNSFRLSQRMANGSTDATESWDLDEISGWTTNEFQETPDLSAIFQELALTTGWKTTSAAMLFFSDMDGADGIFRATSAFTSDVSKRAHLYISWTLEGSDENFNCYVIAPELQDLPPTANFVNGSNFIGVDLSDDSFDGGVCSAANFITYTGGVSSCYAVAETYNELRIFNRFSGEWITVGDHGIQELPAPADVVEEVEAIAMDEEGNVFTVNVHNGQGYFGSLDPFDGEFTPVGPSIGTGENAAGVALDFTDVDAITFNPETGLFWAMTGQNIFKIDPNTGQFVPNEFSSPGKDYILVTGLPDAQIDDIAIDPTDGTIYAINDNGGGFGDYVLVTIDPETAMGTVISNFTIDGGDFLTDLEGMGFTPDGELYAVTGEQALVYPDRAFFVDKTNGVCEVVATFNESSDMEGCACKNGADVSMTNPGDIGTVIGEDCSEDFDVIGTIDCASDDNTYVVILNVQGGNPGSNGYTVVNNNTGETFGNVSGPVFQDGPYDNGSGFSYTVFVNNQPGCSETVSLSLVDCVSTAIELLSFDGKAEAKQNLLFWTTASEIDNDFFIIEKSENGLDFEALAQVQSRGNSNLSQNYQWADESPLNRAYYRLSNVNLDGKIVSSQVLLIERNQLDLAIQVYPTLVESDLSVSLPEIEALLTITNITGKVVYQTELKEQAFYEINLQFLNTGNYFVSITNQAQSIQYVRKIFKK